MYTLSKGTFMVLIIAVIHTRFILKRAKLKLTYDILFVSIKSSVHTRMSRSHMQAALLGIPPHTTHLSNPCHTESTTESTTDSTNADYSTHFPIPTPPHIQLYPTHPTLSPIIPYHLCPYKPHTPMPHNSDPTRFYLYSTPTSTHHTHPTQTLLNPPRPISTLSNLTPTHLHLYSRPYHSSTPYPIPTLPILTYTQLPPLPTVLTPPKPSYTHPTPFHSTHSYIYPPPSLLTSTSHHYTLLYPTPTLPTLTYTKPPPLPTILTHPILHTPTQHHTIPPNPLLSLSTSISTHVYITTLHPTLPYSDPTHSYLYLYPTPHHTIHSSLISFHLHFYPRLYHNTTPYPTLFRPTHILT